ncbi:MAG: imidazoleglycerol-phosphate dehydratase HisB [Calditrichaeota bacterium]|nr:MAG: imidazoleglycerol-phosphate dehydratase HisB [Calditrichota bacterium]
MSRKAKINRKTGETNIALSINIDGSGKAEIATGIGFFDHMLHLLAVHSLVDIEIKAEGDLHVDFHHTVEDVGIALGAAFLKAVGDKKGIYRYGTAYVPLDEALARTVIDFCDRPFLCFNHELNGTFAGQFPGELVEDFLMAFANNARLTLHCDILKGRNVHHMIEVVFKSLGQAIRKAVSDDAKRSGVPSSKGVL